MSEELSGSKSVAAPKKLHVLLASYIEDHADAVFLLLVTLCALAARYSLRNFESGDYVDFLLPWYEAIKNNGGFLALDTQVGNYNIPYQTLIALFTYLPIRPLVAYKLLSVCFDFVLAAAAARLAWRVAPAGKRRKLAVLSYSLTVMWPVVAINSAQWAQCDSIWTAFACWRFSISSTKDISVALPITAWRLPSSCRLFFCFLFSFLHTSAGKGSP